MAPFDLSKIVTLAGRGLSVKGFRNQASGFDPRSGDGARRFGGRFNRPHSYPVVYLCSTRPCVVAELRRQARRQGLAVEDLLPRELWLVTAALTKVLDLTDTETLRVLGVEPDELVRDDLQLTHDIGEAAHEHRFQAILTIVPKCRLRWSTTRWSRSFQSTCGGHCHRGTPKVSSELD